MLIGLLLLVLTGARAAPGAEPPSPSPPTEPGPAQSVPSPSDPCQADPPDRSAPFALELERAISLYRQGCHAWALDLLRDLDVRRQLAVQAPPEAIEQRRYLGEVLMVLGRRQEAEDTFRLLLTEHPDTQMGLLQHAPEAVNLFEQVKASIERRPVGPADKPPRRKAYTYLPFGVAHFAAGDSRRGLLYGSVQGAFYGVAIATFILGPGGPPGSGNADAVRRGRLFRALNFTSNAGFLLTYTFSQLDARQRWRAKYDLAVSPTGVGVRATW